MLVIQMLVAIIVIFVGNHLIGWTLKTHAHVTPAACYSETTVCPYDRHLAVLVRAHSHSILLHVPLEQCVAPLFRLLTSQSLMEVLLTLRAI